MTPFDELLCLFLSLTSSALWLGVQYSPICDFLLPPSYGELHCSGLWLVDEIKWQICG